MFSVCTLKFKTEETKNIWLLKFRFIQKKRSFFLMGILFSVSMEFQEKNLFEDFSELCCVHNNYFIWCFFTGEICQLNCLITKKNAFGVGISAWHFYRIFECQVKSLHLIYFWMHSNNSWITWNICLIFLWKMWDNLKLYLIIIFDRYCHKNNFSHIISQTKA